MLPTPTPTGRVLAVGDIHGCSRAFDTLLALIDLKADDLLVTLGDHVDRGPDSAGVLDRLIQLRTQFRLVSLRGNHEEMMLAARHREGLRGWLMCGGRETLASYARSGTVLDAVEIPDAHWDFLENCCIDWYETETHFFVHANACADMDLAEQPGYLLRWDAIHPDQQPHCSGKVMICGHTSQRTGVPLDLGHAVCIDTWVYGQGWLTALDVKSGRLWQANQHGETRTGWLGAAEELR